jgi:uncharacterized membrane protein
MTVTSFRRVPSVDIVRGAVMILMALDHVRVYSGIPAGGPAPEVFLTRWVTHFCAPAFLFLAGTSIFLSSKGARPTAALTRQLLIRGAWLVILELTFIRLAWTFNLAYADNLLAGVIWAIGWCMIVMAALIHLPRTAIAGFGILVIAGHNFVGSFVLQNNPWENPYHWLVRIVYAGGWFNLGSQGSELVVLYSIIPWIGVMAAGYAFGSILTMDPGSRDRACYLIGFSAIALFVLLRSTNLYGDPSTWPDDFPRHAAWTAFLNPRKYPASFQFLLMTLGPTIAVMPLLEKARGKFAKTVALFGRVPMFFYLLHIPLIHLTVLAIAAFRSPESIGWLFESHPLPQSPVPEGYTFSIGLLYAVWAAVSVALFFPCHWYAGIRPGLPKWWRNLL